MMSLKSFLKKKVAGHKNGCHKKYYKNNYIVKVVLVCMGYVRGCQRLLFCGYSTRNTHVPPQ